MALFMFFFSELSIDNNINDYTSKQNWSLCIYQQHSEEASLSFRPQFYSFTFLVEFPSLTKLFTKMMLCNQLYFNTVVKECIGLPW